MEYRKCIKCREVKPLGEFPIERRIVGGRHVKCKECADHDKRLFDEHTRQKRNAPKLRAGRGRR